MAEVFTLAVGAFDLNAHQHEASRANRDAVPHNTALGRMLAEQTALRRYIDSIPAREVLSTTPADGASGATNEPTTPAADRTAG